MIYVLNLANKLHLFVPGYTIL